MRYSLLNRFRGAFLGAALGEILGVNCQNCFNQQLNIPWLEIDRWGYKRIDSTTVAGNLGKFAVQQAEVLLGEAGDRFPQPDVALQQNSSTQSIEAPQQIEDRVAIFSEKDDDLTENLAHNPAENPAENLAHNPAENLAQGVDAPFDLAAQLMTILPLILFQHDNFALLQASITESLAAIAPAPALNRFAYTIALALQNQLVPAQLRAQLDSAYPLPASVNSFTLALAAFLETPDDFRLTLLQAAHHPRQTQEICAIAGAISGAYNSITGIPLAWRKALKQHPPTTSPLFTLWTLTTEDELLALSDRLLAAWSGIHPAQLDQAAVGSLPVTAAPAVMR